MYKKWIVNCFEGVVKEKLGSKFGDLNFRFCLGKGCLNVFGCGLFIGKI